VVPSGRNALAYDTILEPLGRAALDRLDLGPDARDSAVAAAASALGDHVTNGEVRLGAGTWVVEARAPRGVTPCRRPTSGPVHLVQWDGGTV
jgi:hypothetical protein